MPRFTTKICTILCFSLLAFQLPLASRAETPPLVENEPILVPATKGKFDYLKVDDQSHTLLADHTGNGTLDVFDLPDGKLRQTVPIGAVHDLAIDQERGKYYVTVSDLRNLTIVDRQTLKVDGSVALPGAADGCAYDPMNRKTRSGSPCAPARTRPPPLPGYRAPGAGDVLSRCAAALGRGTRRGDRHGALPYPASPCHL